MATLKFNGPLSARLTSFLALSKIAMATYARHAVGKRMEPSWDAYIETGVRFWRHQFTRAMNQTNFSSGRTIIDSLLTETDDIYSVTTTETKAPKGRWYHPEGHSKGATLLYLHGGGYAFNGPISERFAAMLAHHTQSSLFAPHYRLTPEHPHPAQAEDALAAWRYVTAQVPAGRVVVIGDSAGGHMALMLLQSLKSAGLRQPALCIGLCPWTDIGERGKSLQDNDQYDLVQGWMALRFGEWLDPSDTYGREHLSPISYDYTGLAPIYLQAGGRENLRDMIMDFAEKQAENGAEIMLDLWDDMPHNFQTYDSLKHSSTEALLRISKAIQAHTDGNTAFTRLPNRTVVAGKQFVSAQ